MFRVSLITRNPVLVNFCRTHLPKGFTLKSATKFHWGKESLQGILLFDSDFLGENEAAILPALAEHYNGKESAVSLCIFANQESKARTLSLFPERLAKIHGVLSYRIEAGKVTLLTASEWHWFLESQRKSLKELSERVLLESENEILTNRLAQISLERNHEVRFPAFLHGKSLAITRFREKILATAASPYLYLTGKGDIPVEDFLNYYAALIRPESPLRWRPIDFAKSPKHLHSQLLWPAKKNSKNELSILCLQNLHLLGWQTQAALITHLRNLSGNQVRIVAIGNSEIARFVRRGTFRQELYSLLKKSLIEIPPLYERIDDISHIAAEYINQSNFDALAEEKIPIAKKILNRFDVSTGYSGLYMTLDLMHDLKKSKGLPVFELIQEQSASDELKAAQTFLREEIAVDPASLFDSLVSDEKNTLSLEAVERHYIAAVCQRYGWQVTEAARHLRISRKTLYDKMRRYKIARPEKRKNAS